jgi:hypothetical protein
LSAHRPGAADGDEPVAPDRKALRDFTTAAPGKDLGVHDDDVGRLREPGMGRGAHKRGDAQSHYPTVQDILQA